MRDRMRALAAGLCACLVAGVGGAQARDLVIHAGVLLDGVSAMARPKMSILVHDDRIVSIEPGYLTPRGAEVVDLTHDTVMPGFIDCHVHVSAKLPSRANAVEDFVTHTSLDAAFDAAVFSRAMLLQGFTSARDVGGGDETVALKNAIAGGKVAGPRLWVSLEPLGPTGGHSDPSNGFDPELSHPGWSNSIVNGADDALRQVRDHRKRGADLIKLMPSGGIASTGDDPRAQLMTDAEIETAVRTAHSLGMKVAAHLYPPTAIEASVRAGVDSVEHGSFATADTFALMKAHGTYLVPTLTVFEIYLKAAREHPELLAPGTAEKELAYDPQGMKNLPLALRSGVKIAYGTDIGEGDHAMEFGLLVRGGMAPADALFAATRNAADLIGASDRIGSLQPGRYADIVSVAGDPLKDVGQFERVQFVMKGGVIYKDGGRTTLASFQ